ncbi:MAG: response regulator [Planctomycetota bacterium]
MNGGARELDSSAALRSSLAGSPDWVIPGSGATPGTGPRNGVQRDASRSTLRLCELTAAMVTRAIDAYMTLAYAPGTGARGRPDLVLPPDAPSEQVLALFQREIEKAPARERDSHAAAGCVTYWMRLGNRNYPFMKLLLQEHIVPGEFYFAVDTHDAHDLKPDFPDYEAWVQLQKFNRELRARIEARFAELGLPTSSSLQALCEQRGAEDVKRPIRIGMVDVVVVDDEEHLAAAVAAVFRARGYRVRTAADGRSGLAAIREGKTDLVVLDYEMPEMDGLEVLAALKSDDRTRSIPVLLCTASKISMQEMRRADGFLAKPYPEALLFEVVDRLLGPPRGEAPR